MIPERLLHFNAWVFFGLLGQMFFTLRFLVQWLASERMGRSVFPVAFWYLSLAGGGILFVYALVYRHDLVFTLGQGAGLAVYARNLVLIRRVSKGDPDTSPQGAAGPGA